MPRSSRPSRYEVIDSEKRGGYQIQGKSATVLEYRVARALEKLDVPYMFQFDVAGGRTRRGGVVVDFLALIPPLSTPIEVQGKYWHQPSHSTEDRLKEAILRNFGGFAEIVYLYEADLQSEQEALSTVRRELRL